MRLDDFSPKKNIKEGKVKELDQDLKDKKVSDADFKKKYNKSKAEVKKEIKPRKKVAEATGDARFDKMMGNITGSETPKAMPPQGTGQIDRQIMELTHKIFLRLREFDDPEVYQKFIDFMVKTINNDVGPLDEERNLTPARKGPSVDFNRSFDYVKQCITNASLNVPPYNTPEFRIDRINEAIRRLELLKSLLMADSAIGNASRK